MNKLKLADWIRLQKNIKINKKQPRKNLYPIPEAPDLQKVNPLQYDLLPKQKMLQHGGKMFGNLGEWRIVQNEISKDQIQIKFLLQQLRFDAVKPYYITQKIFLYRNTAERELKNIIK
jgi:hypothetical protein